MTILKCAATTCVYNKDLLCSKGEIDVMGEDAHNPKDTCCGSFREKSSSGMTNSYSSKCGCTEIRIDCQARNCLYNENKKCTAGSIYVGGSQASNSAETTCDTFKAK